MKASERPLYSQPIHGGQSVCRSAPASAFLIRHQQTQAITSNVFHSLLCLYLLSLSLSLFWPPSAPGFILLRALQWQKDRESVEVTWWRCCRYTGNFHQSIFIWHFSSLLFSSFSLSLHGYKKDPLLFFEVLATCKPEAMPPCQPRLCSECLKKILTERMQICREITNQVFPLRGEDESFAFHRRQNRLFRGFQCLRWTDQAEEETRRKEEWWVLREKEINTCGGEAGWLFNYKVLPRSKSGQLQMFQTWLENRIPGGGGASWQVPLWVPWEKKQLCKWLWNGLRSDRKEKTEGRKKKW